MQPATLGAREKFIYRIPMTGMQRLLLCLLAILACGPASRAQQSGLETSEQTNERLRAFSAAAQSVKRDYVIGNGDLVSVEVFDVQELTRDVRVSQTGTITLPLLPVRLHVSGLTELQAEQKIAEVLEANGLITHPQVSVSVKEKKSKPITVTGAVMHPTVFQADHEVTLVEALAEAGGIAADAGSVVIVTRTAHPISPENTADEDVPAAGVNSAPPATSQPESGPTAGTDPAAEGAAVAAKPVSPSAPTAAGAEAAKDPAPVEDLTAQGAPLTLTINLNNLLESGDQKENLLLQGGDVVTVPHGGIVYVIGAVGHPGGFVLAGDRTQMSTLKILSLAGGLESTAKADSAVILRKDQTGQQREMVVHLKKIMQRQDEDVTLLPNDILYVPESNGKRAAFRLAQVALGIGAAAAILRVTH
ncbi:MAG: polysaccharide biosynthesis/export family protein [Acidobacteriia bacterium]|nr:polysaccharide biosynthesis/export family protein [Terriglobia bacterium]